MVAKISLAGLMGSHASRDKDCQPRPRPQEWELIAATASCTPGAPGLGANDTDGDVGDGHRGRRQVLDQEARHPKGPGEVLPEGHKVLRREHEL